MTRLQFPIGVVRCDAEGCRRWWRLRRLDAFAPPADLDPTAAPDLISLNLCPVHMRWWRSGEGIALRRSPDDPLVLTLDGRSPNRISATNPTTGAIYTVDGDA